MKFASWWSRANSDTEAPKEEAQSAKAKPHRYTTVDHLPPMQHPHYLAVHIANVGRSELSS